MKCAVDCLSQDVTGGVSLCFAFCEVFRVVGAEREHLDWYEWLVNALRVLWNH